MSMQADIQSNIEARASEGQSLLGHPRSLFYIVFTEAWERFSFYGMQALLVLYMVGGLLHPGHVENVIGFVTFRAALERLTGPLSPQALATQVFGLYGGLTYLTPILGGVVGDSRFGRRRAVALGALVMAIGHFLMAIESCFLLALAALLIGCGLLKGNLATQLGELYDKSDQRSDRAFSLYYLGINVGAFVAPLVCGTLGELLGWHYGFGVAGVGMLVGLGIYLSGLRHMPAERSGKGATPTPPLTRRDAVTIVALAAVLLVATSFWTAITQIWNTYSLWLRDHVDRGVGGFEVPITWFQSLNSLFVLVLAPVVMLLWRRQAKRGAEPLELTKIALGCAIFAGSVAWLALGQAVAGAGQVSLLWPLTFAVLSSAGYLYIAPVAIALFSRAAPSALGGVMIAIYYVSIFLGSTISGWLGRFYEILSPASFWLMHAAIVGAGGVLCLILSRPLRRALRL